MHFLSPVQKKRLVHESSRCFCTVGPEPWDYSNESGHILNEIDENNKCKHKCIAWPLGDKGGRSSQKLTSLLTNIQDPNWDLSSKIPPPRKLCFHTCRLFVYKKDYKRKTQ